MPDVISLVQYAMALIFVGFGAVILFKLLRWDLSGLISEGDGKASISRFQLLLFTFVIAGIFLALSLEVGSFVEIPNGVLGLMGISGGSFVVSKAIAAKDPKVAAANPIVPPAAAGPAAPANPANNQNNPQI